MATIPHLGTGSAFGRRGPDRTGPLNPDTRGMTAGLQGLAELAQTGQRVAGQVAQQIGADQRQAEVEAEALARAKGANAVLDYELAIKARTLDLESRHRSGDIGWRDMEGAANEAFDEVEIPQVEGLAPDDAERLRGGFTRARAAGMFTVQAAAQEARRAEFKGQVVALRDTLGKFASDPNADLDKLVAQGAAARELATAAGLGDTFDKDHQAFVDQVYFDNAKARLNVVRGSLEGLAALEQSITGEGGRYAGKLDASKQNALLSQISTYRSQLESRAMHAADRAEAAADRAIEQFDRQTASGVPPPIEQLEAWSSAVAGTSRAAEWTERLEAAAEVQAILQRPPEEQQAFLQQLTARQQAQGATVAQQANLTRLRTAVEANLKQLRTEPLVFHANRTGEPVAPLDFQALLSGDLASVRAQFDARMDTLTTIRKQYGPQAGIAPLLPQEAQALTGALTQATPQQAVKLYGALAQAIADPAAYRGALQQIAPDAPVMAAAGILHERSPKGALLVLKGAQLLDNTEGKGGKFPMPSAGDFEFELAQLVGSAFRDRPAAFALAMQTVRAGYAGAAATDGDVSGELNVGRLEDVVRFTLGERVEVHGSEVFAPLGMEPDDFEDALEAAWQQQRPANAPEDLGRFRLQQHSTGTFYVIRGRDFLYGDNGQPLLLTVNP